jgi:MarR family transcriptional regulator, organic hydroperoxide resistance regulator
MQTKKSSIPPEEEILVLLHQINRTVCKSGNCLIPSHDLSFGKYQAIQAISDGADTITSIASGLKIALPTATILMNKLVKDNLVKRTSNLKDRRVTKLSLTSKGKTALTHATKSKTNHVKAFMTNLSKTDKNTLLQILRKAAKV